MGWDKIGSAAVSAVKNAQPGNGKEKTAEELLMDMIMRPVIEKAISQMRKSGERMKKAFKGEE